ncbi:hypothetical protein BGZ91_011087 [Linnemannia elongata]|nr:hypothetical protein BGZ91_011087 [Linnemannia elongata]KAG0080530.1 hypothetical protein BGZ90_012016 [Linnemannia elongata]
MDRNELVAWIKLIADKIELLEQTEDLLLQNLFTGPEGANAFSIAFEAQSHHYNLSSFREKIYDLGVKHCDVIASLRKVDFDLALELNRAFFHSMLMRLKQIRV